MLYVDDVEAHLARARAAGAVIVTELATSDYGPETWVDRGYSCRDVGGHPWWISERVESRCCPDSAGTASRSARPGPGRRTGCRRAMRR